MAYELRGVKYHLFKNAQYYMSKGQSGYRITSDYTDAREHPLTGTVKPHPAIDLTGSYGWAATDDVIAPWAGKIVKIERNVTLCAGTGEGKDARVAEINRLGIGSGNYVRLRHNSHYETVYKHMQHGKVTNKNVGEIVNVAEVLGYMGTTGMSTAPHLHFEVIKDGVCVDPKPYLLGQIQIISDYEGGSEMGYPVLAKDEYVNKDTKEAESITKLQQILKYKYGYDIAVNGEWTDELLKAVIDYQTANGLGVDGRCGPATIIRLNRDIYDEIKGLRAEKESLEEAVAKSKQDEQNCVKEMAKLQLEMGKLVEERNNAYDGLKEIKSAIEILKKI
jgi:hypothetical protein